MFGVPDYGAFVVAIIVFLAIPGPGNLALLTATAQGGVRAGLAATFGVIAGDQTLLWLAVAGVAAVLLTHPEWFAWVQWTGAAYLTWLGWRLWRAKPGDEPVLKLQPHHFFRQALFITLLNPKAIVFYMAFFPLFVDPTQHQGVTTFAFMAATIEDRANVPIYHLLGANRDLAGAEVELVDLERRENRLKAALAEIDHEYDFVLIDCPPSLSMLTLNGLCAANGVVVPMQCEYFALEGLTDLVNTIKQVHANLNRELKIIGLLRVMFDRHPTQRPVGRSPELWFALCGL